MHNDIMVELFLLLGQRLSIGQRIIAFWFIWFNLGCGKESALLLLLAPDLFLHCLGLEIRRFSKQGLLMVEFLVLGQGFTALNLRRFVFYTQTGLDDRSHLKLHLLFLILNRRTSHHEVVHVELAQWAVPTICTNRLSRCWLGLGCGT